MITSAIENELHEQFVRLPFERQRQVLEYARALATERPHGVAGKSLLRFAGTIAADDLELMSTQINDSCEKVDTFASEVIRSNWKCGKNVF